MANFDASAAVTTVWQRQSVWSQAATAEKRRVARARRTVAALTIGAAVAGSLATQLGDPHRTASRCLAILAGAALLLVPVAARWTSRDSVHAWTRLRSVSEALKADVHRYLAGVAPFAGADRDRVLLRRADTVLDDAGDLVAHTLGGAPVA
ncbi:DUF4231 domain-containing protein, partial [Micromonospora sp. CPCC 205714]|uniref:DUF4231 domain-containing protein n=1 Tax=Micromonospora sp. CPCC 205714 TaxID=3122402 RepID=UPI002FF1CB2C